MGLFITIEGGEGVGKSTVAKKIHKMLKEDKVKSIITREPGGSVLSEKIRSLIMEHSEMSKKTELLLFNAARSEHMKHINENLAKDKVVICDRFVDSTLVYQTTEKGTYNIVWDINTVKDKDVKSINEFTIDSRYPDLTFILDMDVEDAQKRIKSNNRETNRFDKESLDFHKTIRDKFIDLSTSSVRYVVIDANRDIDDVAMDIYKHIKAVLSIT